MRELIRNVWKFVCEVKVKCGTFTPNAWSLAGIAASEITEWRCATDATVWKKHRRASLFCLLSSRKGGQDKGAPECPKEIEEMNKCARVKLELLIIDAWAIYFHFDAQTQCVYETWKKIQWLLVLFWLKCELRFMYNIASCTFDWYFVVVSSK